MRKLTQEEIEYQLELSRHFARLDENARRARVRALLETAEGQSYQAGFLVGREGGSALGHGEGEVVGQLRLLQKLLGLPQSEQGELYCRPFAELCKRRDALEAQLQRGETGVAEVPSQAETRHRIPEDLEEWDDGTRLRMPFTTAERGWIMEAIRAQETKLQRPALASLDELKHMPTVLLRQRLAALESQLPA